ncbi:MAG: hypothetical protein WCI53_12720 [Bacteroidota bacterium]
MTDTDKNVTSDDSPKFFKISVEIYPASNEIQEEEEHPYIQTSFGLCFTGSYLNGSILADTIEEVLSNIQATPLSDISIDNLSDIAFAVYKQVSRQLMQIHNEKGLTTVLLGGFCPFTTEFKLYKFAPKPIIPGQLVDFTKSEIILVNDIVFIGDSAAEIKARQLLNNSSNQFTPFHILRDIIKDATFKTVGGNIQAGLFKANKFKTFGIIEYEVVEDENGQKQINQSFKFRNLSLNLDDNELRKGDLNILKTFFNPFEQEWINYFNEVIDDIEQ